MEEEKNKEQTTPKKLALNKTAFWILVIAIAVLFTTSAVSAFFVVRQILTNKGTKEPSAYILGDEPEITNANQQLADETEEAQEQEEEENQIKEDLTEGEIFVEWNDWPVKKYYNEVFNYEFVRAQLADSKNYDGTPLDVVYFLNQFNVYKVGSIKKGPYSGHNLYIITYRPEGPAFRDDMYRVIAGDDLPILLQKYSDKLGGDFLKIFSVNNKVNIANYSAPDKIQLPNSNLTLLRGKDEPYKFLTSYDDPIKLFKYNDKDYVYRDKSQHCIFIKENDGTVREYFYDLDFYKNGGGEYQYWGMTPSILDFRWNDGIKNTIEYTSYRGSCGGRGCLKYVDYITNKNQIKEAGSTSGGDKIYELIDLEVKENSSQKASVLEEMYEYHYPAYNSETKEGKVSFEKFLADHPIIFWQDPFGYYVEFRNNKYVPAAECGKPVIYLYPEHETDVNVWVNPTGGFSVTEPAYNNGWKVFAKPSGELYNYGDQQKYPYLFWEGRGLNYKRPEQGFVVAVAEVEKFLEEKLAKLGLIKNEYNEFIEFWLPKMQDAPYYFITFVSKEEFDELAPLTVNPKPDTVIRVFMDYQPLDRYVEVEPQRIVTPKRVGFTVVEWGGALHK